MAATAEHSREASDAPAAPPLRLPRWMVEDWGMMPLPPHGYEWVPLFDYCGWEARPCGAAAAPEGSAA